MEQRVTKPSLLRQFLHSVGTRRMLYSSRPIVETSLALPT